jgi:hypothetical protein
MGKTETAVGVVWNSPPQATNKKQSKTMSVLFRNNIPFLTTSYCRQPSYLSNYTPLLPPLQAKTKVPFTLVAQDSKVGQDSNLACLPEQIAL